MCVYKGEVETKSSVIYIYTRCLMLLDLLLHVHFKRTVYPDLSVWRSWDGFQMSIHLQGAHIDS